jgi:hypothetical protein
VDQPRAGQDAGLDVLLARLVAQVEPRAGPEQLADRGDLARGAGQSLEPGARGGPARDRAPRVEIVA